LKQKYLKKPSKQEQLKELNTINHQMVYDIVTSECLKKRNRKLRRYNKVGTKTKRFI